ncbi:hypothetical protein LUZ60_007725 [Juncus effusus]|nr:hypothetical protein LUZ60_007725 [Juncus effusus]
MGRKNEKATQAELSSLTSSISAPMALAALVQPFHPLEVWSAVSNIKKGKTSRPDGMPIELIQKMWLVMAEDIMKVITAFYTNRLDLCKINKASITLIPKKEGANKIDEFRPISVISTPIKIISKLLADRLQPLLPQIIHSHQTAFIKNRSIAETFIVTREVANFFKKRKIPAVLMKIDFKKAFDNIAWSYLMRLLKAKGFPDLWIMWIHNILLSSSSSIKVNGTSSEFFYHQRGVRQGDPLSPMLFNIAVDVLQDIIKKIDHLFLKSYPLETQILQYADDTIIAIEAHPENLKLLSIALDIFTEISGLEINWAKSSFIPIGIPEHLHQVVKELLRCDKNPLPCKYLGLPLTLTKPNQIAYMPLLKRIQDRMASWKGKFLSKGGRITLIQSTLKALPVYMMQVLKLPKGFLLQLERIIRTFLWKGNDEYKPGSSLINWETVTLPKRNGGLGIPNSEGQNEALLLKWLWKLDGPNQSIWKDCMNKLYGINSTADLTTPSTSNASYFVRDLASLLNKYHTSTVVDPTTGTTVWRWTPSGNFSSKSAYTFLRNPGLHCRWQKSLWKTKAPLKVRFFFWLALHNRVNTVDKLRRKGVQLPLLCTLCKATAEDRDHLFINCSFMRATWKLAEHYSNAPRKTSLIGTLPQLWEKGRVSYKNGQAKDWQSLMLAITWCIWKERNARIFNGKTQPPLSAARKAVDEATLWKKYC